MSNETFLTKEQVFELNTKFGWFEYGDACSEVSRAFAQAAIAKHELLRAAAPYLLAACVEMMRYEPGAYSKDERCDDDIDAGREEAFALMQLAIDLATQGAS